jgi:hypothetical protein
VNTTILAPLAIEMADDDRLDVPDVIAVAIAII